MGDFPVLDGPAAKLSSKEKAAIVVRLLLSYGAVPALTELPESKQTELAVQLAKMTPVDQETVAAVATEFADEIERIGLSFPTGLDGALGLLDGVISDGASSRLRQMAPAGYRGNPWDDIGKAEVERLVPYLENEATEVAAVILSKLDVGKAAEILGKLPGEQSRRITYAVSQTSKVSPAVVHRIGTSLAEELSSRPVEAFSEGPVKRVGAILNYAPASVRDDVLTGLDDEDKIFEERPEEELGEDATEEEGNVRRLDDYIYDGTGKPCPQPNVRSFKTAPVSAIDTPVSFAMIGDLGQFGHSRGSGTDLF